MLSRAGIANFDILSVLPVRCAFQSANFYHYLLVKTLGPIAFVMSMWLYPLGCVLARRPTAGARRSVAYCGLLFLELVLPTVSTTIAQTLVCDSFDDGMFLRAQLTIPCNGRRRRKLWVAYSISMLAVYPLGA